MRHRGGGRIARVFPGEDDVVGGEGLAVVPGHALLQAPADDLAALEHAAVGDARDLGGEDRHQVAVVVPDGERLVEDARAFLVLGAVGEVRLEQRRRLATRASSARRRRRAWSACRRAPAARCATPACISSIEAIGAVRPRPTIRWMKRRRGSFFGAHVFDQGAQLGFLHQGLLESAPAQVQGKPAAMLFAARQTPIRVRPGTGRASTASRRRAQTDKTVILATGSRLAALPRVAARPHRASRCHEPCPAQNPSSGARHAVDPGGCSRLWPASSPAVPSAPTTCAPTIDVPAAYKEAARWKTAEPHGRRRQQPWWQSTATRRSTG